MKRPGIEPRTPRLSHQYSAAEPRQPDNHQPSQSSICTAQVVRNASVAHPAATDPNPNHNVHEAAIAIHALYWDLLSMQTLLTIWIYRLPSSQATTELELQIGSKSTCSSTYWNDPHTTHGTIHYHSWQRKDSILPHRREVQCYARGLFIRLTSLYSSVEKQIWSWNITFCNLVLIGKFSQLWRCVYVWQLMVSVLAGE